MRISLIYVTAASFFIITSFVTPVFSVHPLITDDTGTQGKGNFQLELNGEHSSEKEDGVTEKKTDFTTIMTYGVIDNIDFIFGIPYQHIETRDTETVRENGFSDASFEIKWKFYEINAFSFAIKPGLSIPTGDEETGLGAGKTTYRIYFISTSDFRPLVIHINLGYMRNENKADETEDLWHASVAGDLEIFSGVRLVANTGVEKNTDKNSRINPAFVLAGIIFSPVEYLDLDAGFKHGLNSPETDYSILTGITLRF